MKSWKTNPDELAEVIFNSRDADLNDLLCEIVSIGKYDIPRMFLEITESVNNTLPLHLRSNVSEPLERTLYLKEEIRVELIYYILYARNRAALGSV